MSKRVAVIGAGPSGLVTERFLHMIEPSIGESLAFIGFLRPAHGAVPPLSELQARYFALLLSGRRALPAGPEMRQSMARIAATRQHVGPDFSAKLDLPARSTPSRVLLASSRPGAQ